MLAATALLGVLLTGVLMAQSRIKRQEAITKHRADAIDALDVLLLEWWANDPVNIPLNRTGQVNGNNQWQWKTQEVFKQFPQPLKARCIRVSINNTRSTDHENNALASVEVLIPIVENENTPSEGSGDA